MNTKLKSRPAISSAINTSAPGTLYQMVFRGGPFDGDWQPSAILPTEKLQVRSGPEDCRTRRGDRLVPRLAEYRLAEVALVAGLTPRVTCHFEYQGTVDPPRRRRRWLIW